MFSWVVNVSIGNIVIFGEGQDGVGALFGVILCLMRVFASIDSQIGGESNSWSVLLQSTDVHGTEAWFGVMADLQLPDSGFVSIQSEQQVGGGDFKVTDFAGRLSFWVDHIKVDITVLIEHVNDQSVVFGASLEEDDLVSAFGVSFLNNTVTAIATAKLVEPEVVEFVWADLVDLTVTEVGQTEKKVGTSVPEVLSSSWCFGIIEKDGVDLKQL